MPHDHVASFLIIATLTIIINVITCSIFVLGGSKAKDDTEAQQ